MSGQPRICRGRNFHTDDHRNNILSVNNANLPSHSQQELACVGYPIASPSRLNSASSHVVPSLACWKCPTGLPLPGLVQFSQQPTPICLNPVLNPGKQLKSVAVWLRRCRFCRRRLHIPHRHPIRFPPFHRPTRVKSNLPRRRRRPPCRYSINEDAL